MKKIPIILFLLLLLSVFTISGTIADSSELTKDIGAEFGLKISLIDGCYLEETILNCDNSKLDLESLTNKNIKEIKVSKENSLITYTITQEITEESIPGLTEDILQETTAVINGADLIKAVEQGYEIDKITIYPYSDFEYSPEEIFIFEGTIAINEQSIDVYGNTIFYLSEKSSIYSSNPLTTFNIARDCSCGDPWFYR